MWNDKLKIYNADESTVASLEEISEILDVGKASDDNSSLRKMRDSYTVLLLAFQNVAKLIHHYYYGSVCILCLYACIAAAILSTRLSIDFPLFLVEFAFFFFVKLVEQFDDLSKSDIKQKNVEGTIAVTISEIHYIKRILNTLVAFGIALRFGNERLKLDALGTHLVENAIGIPRQTSFDPRWERILATFCHVKIRKCLAKSLGIQIRV